MPATVEPATVEFADVIKQGAGTVALPNPTPNVSGHPAAAGTFGIDTSGGIWVKYGAADSAWINIPVLNVVDSNIRIHGSVLQIRDFDNDDNFLGWRTLVSRNGALSTAPVA